MELLKRFVVEEEGQGLTEYALILGLVVLGVWVVVANSGLGSSISNIFTAVNTVTGGCTSGSCP